HLQYIGVNAHLLNRINNKGLLEMQLGNEYRKNDLDTKFSIFRDDLFLSSPEGFQNQIRYAVNDLYLKNKYTFKLREFELTGKVNFHQLFNELKNSDQTAHQHPFFANPTLKLKWNIDPKNTISTSYSYNTTNATILDVYNHYSLTGFRSFSKGTGQFDQLSASDLTFYYQLGNCEDLFFAYLTDFYKKYHDFFLNRMIIRQDFIKTEKILIKNKTLLNVNTQADYFFNSIKTDLKVNLGYSKADYKNRVNNSGIRKVVSDNFKYGLSLSSTFDGLFNFSIGTQWQTKTIKT